MFEKGSDIKQSNVDTERKYGPQYAFSNKNHVQMARVFHGFCCLKTASGLFDNSFKQLYISMQELLFPAILLQLQ